MYKFLQLMSNYCAKLAPYQFLTAFPQLTSRICHAHDGVFSQLREMIAKLIVVFPQQTMWMMMAVSKVICTLLNYSSNCETGIMSPQPSLTLKVVKVRMISSTVFSLFIYSSCGTGFSRVARRYNRYRRKT